MQPCRNLGDILRFGPFEVDLRQRMLRKRGVRVRLQAQPFQVLIALLEAPGAAVSREELRRRIWPDDTFVDFEHGLNAAVTRLRQALGDSAENPRYIQTLPKHGYRFCANVDRGAAASAEPEVAPPPGASSKRRVARWSPVFLAGLAAGVFLLSGVSDRSAVPELRSVPLTSFPGYEAQPALSRDGTHVAFSWDGERQDNVDIYTIRIDSRFLTRITSDPAVDIAPAWSPDGRTIAFLRRTTGDRGELLLVSAAGGPEYRVGEIRNMELRIARSR